MSVALARAARTLGLGVVSVLLLATGVAAAEDGSLAQRMAFAERGQGLVVTTTIGRLFDSTAYDALDSGFPTTIVIRLWVYPKGKGGVEDARAIHMDGKAKFFGGGIGFACMCCKKAYGKHTPQIGCEKVADIANIIGTGIPANFIFWVGICGNIGGK